MASSRSVWVKKSRGEEEEKERRGYERYGELERGDEREGLLERGRFRDEN